MLLPNDCLYVGHRLFYDHDVHFHGAFGDDDSQVQVVFVVRAHVDDVDVHVVFHEYYQSVLFLIKHQRMVDLVDDEHLDMTVHLGNLHNWVQHDIEVVVRLRDSMKVEASDMLVEHDMALDGHDRLQLNHMNMELLGRSGNSQPEIYLIIFFNNLNQYKFGINLEGFMKHLRQVCYMVFVVDIVAVVVDMLDGLDSFQLIDVRNDSV